MGFYGVSYGVYRVYGVYGVCFGGRLFLGHLLEFITAGS